jgi:hypothetical protein
LVNFENSICLVCGFHGWDNVGASSNALIVYRRVSFTEVGGAVQDLRFAQFAFCLCWCKLLKRLLQNPVRIRLGSKVLA